MPLAKSRIPGWKGLFFIIIQGRRYIKEVTENAVRIYLRLTSPRNTKKSSRNSKRPLVLTSCPERRRRFLDWYFGIYNLYKKAVLEYLSGNLAAVFPPGTYRPPGPFVLP